MKILFTIWPDANITIDYIVIYNYYLYYIIYDITNW